MPSYDYRCAANGRVVEVRHRMSEKLTTWGEVCARAQIDVGDTATNAPVERLIRRCLERDPARRLRDIGEARILLEDL